MYEAFRIFRDRLVDVDAKRNLETVIYGELKAHLKYP